MIECLNSGADDYLGKPFEPQEFIARVRAVSAAANGAVVSHNKVLLRRREALILEALLIRRGRIITRGAPIETIDGFGDDIESNTREAQVSRLRKKLTELGGDVEIRSVRASATSSGWRGSDEVDH